MHGEAQKHHEHKEEEGVRVRPHGRPWERISKPPPYQRYPRGREPHLEGRPIFARHLSGILIRDAKYMAAPFRTGPCSADDGVSHLAG